MNDRNMRFLLTSRISGIFVSLWHQWINEHFKFLWMYIQLSICCVGGMDYMASPFLSVFAQGNADNLPSSGSTSEGASAEEIQSLKVSVSTLLICVESYSYGGAIATH